MSKSEIEQRRAEYLEWLYAVHGRAGGVARAESARRIDGAFARSAGIDSSGIEREIQLLRNALNRTSLLR